MSNPGSVDTETRADCLPVRVWMGYALPRLREGKGRAEFYDTLGSVFIPATVQIMQPLGLTAYLPTVLPADNDLRMPDEVALVCYPSCRHYERARDSSTGGRAYQKLHGTVFNFQSSPEVPVSHSGFPRLFEPLGRETAPNGNYSLFQDMVDWQRGTPVVFLAGIDTASRSRVIHRFAELRSSPPEGLDSLIFSLNDGFVVVWTHWRDQAVTLNLLADIEGLCPVINTTYERMRLPMPVTTEFPGVPVRAGSSYNFQFNTVTTS